MPMIRIKGQKQARASASADVASASKWGEDNEVDDNSDEPQKVREAALTLCLMSCAKVNEETLAKLWKSVKRTYTSERKMVSDENFKEDEEIRVAVPRNDRAPRAEGLEVMMGERSEQFKKILTRSDVDDVQARLNMRKESVVNHVLPLLKEDENIHEGISVTTYNSDGVGFPMVFKVWCRKSNILTSGWIKFVHANGLKRRLDECITIQAFRHADTDELSFLVSPAEN